MRSARRQQTLVAFSALCRHEVAHESFWVLCFRSRRLIAWQQIARWTKTGKPEEDIKRLILQAATDQLKPWIPFYKEVHNRKDTDLYCWNRQETYTNLQGVY
jgi:hypothetical protein